MPDPDAHLCINPGLSSSLGRAVVCTVWGLELHSVRVPMLKGSPTALRADARGKGRLLPVHAGRLSALTSLHLEDGCAASCWPAMCAYERAEADRFYAEEDWFHAEHGDWEGPSPAAANRFAPIPDALAGLAALTGMPPALTPACVIIAVGMGAHKCKNAA